MLHCSNEAGRVLPVSSTSSSGGFGPVGNVRAVFFVPLVRVRLARVSAVYFTIVAIVLYFVADRILDAMERRAGRRFEQRGLIFFALLLVMALVTFAIIRRVFESG